MGLARKGGCDDGGLEEEAEDWANHYWRGLGHDTKIATMSVGIKSCSRNNIIEKYLLIHPDFDALSEKIDIAWASFAIFINTYGRKV